MHHVLFLMQYDHLLKLSHTFNIMDARGAVGVTERAKCFGTLRNLARQITGKQCLSASAAQASKNRFACLAAGSDERIGKLLLALMLSLATDSL